MGSNWDELVAMKDKLIGRDVEVYESGHTWRGPIKDIRIEGTQFVIETSWSAECDWSDNWTMITDGPFGINRLTCSTDWGSWGWRGEAIHVSIPMMGTADILPKSAGCLGVVLVTTASAAGR